MIMTGSVISIVPILLIFLAGQRYFIAMERSHCRSCSTRRSSP
jgi:ABC-type glycerol-3-phosphate transport system permease component